MTIHFGYNRSQVLNGLRYHFFSRREIRLMIVLVNVFALLSIVLYYSRKILPLAFLFGSLVWFLLMIAFWVLMPWLVYKRNQTFKDHFTMQFREDGFTLGNDVGQRNWDWHQVTEVKESPNFFYIYFNKNSFFMVPKSAFASTEEVSEARSMLLSRTARP